MNSGALSRHAQTGQKMWGALLILLWVLSGAARGTQPTGGYCIGNTCFAVFEERADFQGAQEVCSRHGGHLMTVRSSVAHDTLSLLLANTSGLFWIGLHLPKGPPDLSSELRGYQWVTKDTSSDFYNWATSSPMNTDKTVSHCIFVTKKTNFQWEENVCQHQMDGFLCEYTFQDGGCPGIQNTNVFYTTPYGFRVEDAVSLPTGSVAEHRDEKKQVCVFGQWMPAPWSCEIQKGGCEHRCTADPENNPVCYCQPGFTINPANGLTCEVAVDDPCIKLDCAHACYKYSDSFLCTCHEGFALADDMKSCVDLNECSDERQCPDNRKCINTQGWFKCVCKDGYQLNGGECVDVDECTSAPCEHICDNNPGGYECSCYEGYKVDPKSPDRCKLHCGKEECAAECDPNNKYQCYCPEGYIKEERGEHSVCIDIDECEFFLSDCDQHCENSFGGYECFCDSGYRLVDKTKCVDKNECESAPCEHICDNNPGGYECSCYEGYKVDPESPDRCKLHCGKEECVAECDPNNKYQCYCPDGYIKEERKDHSVCIDIDECEFFLYDCEQHCKNSYGGYECFCDSGYTLVGKNKCVKGLSGTTEVPEVLTVEPTHRPSGVSVGGFVGIIICTVICILLAVFLINHLLCGKGKTESPETLKSPDCSDTHSLKQVTTDTNS